MDIEANEYVRTNGGCIGIFQKYEEEGISQWFTMLQNGTLYTTATKAIVKHSKNIIDLIEVGDIVEIILNEITGGTTKVYIADKEQLEAIRTMNVKILKSILTNKQFEENCYKVKGE